MSQFREAPENSDSSEELRKAINLLMMSIYDLFEAPSEYPRIYRQIATLVKQILDVDLSQETFISVTQYIVAFKIDLIETRSKFPLNNDELQEWKNYVDESKSLDRNCELSYDEPLNSYLIEFCMNNYKGRNIPVELTEILMTDEGIIDKHLQKGKLNKDVKSSQFGKNILDTFSNN